MGLRWVFACPWNNMLHVATENFILAGVTRAHIKSACVLPVIVKAIVYYFHNMTPFVSCGYTGHLLRIAAALDQTQLLASPSWKDFMGQQHTLRRECEDCRPCGGPPDRSGTRAPLGNWVASLFQNQGGTTKI